MSNFRPDTGGRRWSLFRFACSVVLWGGRGAADKCHWRVWGALSVFPPHWVCLHSRVCAFPVYTAQAPGCCIGSRPCVACSSSFRVLHKSVDSIGPAFCAFPGPSSSGSQDLDGCTPLRVQCTFSPPRSQPQFPSTPVGCVRLVSVPGSWPLDATLLANVDHPESQEVFG